MTASLTSPDSTFAEAAAVQAAFDEAALRAGLTESRYRVAGRSVLLRIVGSGVERRVTRALAHLAEDTEAERPSRADLTVHVWDTATSAVTPPTPPVGMVEEPGAFFLYADDRVRLGFERGVDRAGDGVSGAQAPTPALTMLDGAAGCAWHWVADARRIPYWVESSPLRFLFDWWLSDAGMQQVHAGAVGTSDGGVLLVGKSGSGKSTSALSSLGSALGYAGDDYVAVGLGTQPWVHSLYSSGKVAPDHLHRLPHLADTLSNSGSLALEKAVVYVNEHWPSSVVAGFPLRAVLMPRVVQGQVESRVRPASSMATLAALAPSTVLQLHSRGEDALARMGRLARTVPGYVLELGSDVYAIPQVIAALIDELAGRA